MATDGERARDERLRRDKADAERGRALYLVGTGATGAYVRVKECEVCFAPIREDVLVLHEETHYQRESA